jgi:hypothetical protein
MLAVLVGLETPVTTALAVLVAVLVSQAIPAHRVMLVTPAVTATVVLVAQGVTQAIPAR